MPAMKYVRLFAGPDGESHFEDVTVEFNSEPPQPFLVSEWQLVERMRFLSFPPGVPGRAHHAPGRLFHVMLAGSWRMQTSDGEIRDFHAGDVVLVEDTTGKGHVTSTQEHGAVVARIQLQG